MSTLQQNWRKGQNMFCLEEGVEREGAVERKGVGGGKWPKQCKKEKLEPACWLLHIFFRTLNMLLHSLLFCNFPKIREVFSYFIGYIFYAFPFLF
jgi:hypothetical protein